MSALQGKMLGGRSPLERIGRGGMGDVYRAQHLRPGHEAAIKVLHAQLASDPDFPRPFEGEAAMDCAAAGANNLKIVASGNPTHVFVNDAFVARLDVSAATIAGDVRIGTGFYTSNRLTGRWTTFEGFTIARRRRVPGRSGAKRTHYWQGDHKE